MKIEILKKKHTNYKIDKTPHISEISYHIYKIRISPEISSIFTSN